MESSYSTPHVRWPSAVELTERLGKVGANGYLAPPSYWSGPLVPSLEPAEVPGAGTASSMLARIEPYPWAYPMNGTGSTAVQDEAVQAAWGDGWVGESGQGALGRLSDSIRSFGYECASDHDAGQRSGHRTPLLCTWFDAACEYLPCRATVAPDVESLLTGP